MSKKSKTPKHTLRLVGIPPCPQCGSNAVSEDGKLHWRCDLCGCKWEKEDSPEVDYLDKLR
jgi:ribosomal protein L37AE/L43A